MNASGIKAYDHNGLVELMQTLNQPPYRVKQLEKWLYAKAVSNYSQMTDIPVSMSSLLVNNFPLDTPTILDRQISQDGTRRYLLQFADGATAECVGIPSEDRLTVCFSTQSGCAMGCTFCATGSLGLTRSLGPGEMVDQLSIVAADFKTRVSNAVAMGQGEPFANYSATLGALRLINDNKLLNIGARHITVSTCGIIQGIQRFAGEPEQFTLAVSLHSAVQKTRDRIMPKMAGQPLEALHAALREYTDKSGRRPTLELALIRGVNDTTAEVDALLGFCRSLHCHVNLIPLNVSQSAKATGSHGGASRPHSSIAARTQGATTGRLEPSDMATVRHFANALVHYGIETSVRISRGADIDGACGQLAARALKSA
jgi:23S rRNA (adenine2503-C2)-methyltransferase